jgi:hypothetical protein
MTQILEDPSSDGMSAISYRACLPLQGTAAGHVDLIGAWVEGDPPTREEMLE